MSQYERALANAYEMARGLGKIEEVCFPMFISLEWPVDAKPIVSASMRVFQHIIIILLSTDSSFIHTSLITI